MEQWNYDYEIQCYGAQHDDVFTVNTTTKTYDVLGNTKTETGIDGKTTKYNYRTITNYKNTI